MLVEQDETGAFRTASGRTAFEKGHIRTARFADLMGDLSDADSPLQFAVPAPGQFAARALDALASALGRSADQLSA